MTLTVEDGTGLAGADSYISLVDAAAFHTAQGNSAWAALASDTVREQCLRRATSYMTVYRKRWAGYRLTSTQALDWPRSEVPRNDLPQPAYYDQASVPQEVKLACAILALKASTTSLLPDQGRRKASVTVGPISTTYESGSPVDPSYPEVDALLEPLMGRAAGHILMVRQ